MEIEITNNICENNIKEIGNELTCSLLGITEGSKLEPMDSVVD